MLVRPALVAFSLASLILSGCGGTEPEEDYAGNARHLGLGPPSFAMIPGEETTLKVVLLDDQGQVVPFSSRRLFTWNSNSPQVSVNDTGAVRVLPTAPTGHVALISAMVDSLMGQTQVVVGAPGVALHLVPPSLIITPDGRITLQGLVETETGERYSGYLLRFTSAGGVVHLTEDGCAITDCVGAAPDRAILFGDSPGTATLAVMGAGQNASIPVTVRYADLVSVTAGGGHSCGLTTDAALFCWGAGLARTPIGVGYPAGLSDIQAGFEQTCGLDGSGLAYCWPTTHEAQAASVSSTVHFTELALNHLFSCGLDTAGAAWCWGENDWGQLGDGTQTPSATPVAVAGGHSFTSIATGGKHNCALTPAGSAYCWGMNFAGELGTTADPNPCAPYECSLVPVAVSGGHVFTQIVAGANHSCGLDAGGAAWCWGYSDKRGGGPGSDASPPYASAPIPVDGGLSFTRLIGGPGHTCGLTATGEAYCWGSNPDGRTGQPPGSVSTIGLDGSPVVLSPRLVEGGRTYSRLDAGGSHTCGMASDGVYCWGDNGSGQVGIYQGNSQLPVRVTGQP